MSFKRFNVFTVVLAGLFLFTACNEDNEMEAGDPPAMPPVSSMSPDFDYFEAGGDGSGRVDQISNWAYAATNVAVYSAILGGTLIVPVTAYKVALTQDVSFDADLGLWIWAYDVNVGAYGDFSVKLTAEIRGADVIWTGCLTKEGYFEDFVWFEGTSAINGESGTWTLYESYETPTPWLSAEWEKSEVEGKANATFTVEKEGDSLGSSISYNATTTGDFNRSVVIVDNNIDNTITAEWHSEDKNGRVKSLAHFQNEEFYCWDDQFQDVDC